MSESEILAKFRNNATGIISAERLEQLIAVLQNLEEIGELREMTGFLRPA
jgi:hypothetical protein